MRRILQQLDLTYLYTLVVENDSMITHYIEGALPPYYSTPGEQEALWEENIEDLRLLRALGRVYISGLQEWENWGVLKSAMAPIRDADGTVRAIAGADVDVSIILRRTRLALLQLLFIGALSILVAIGASFLISRRLIDPLRQLGRAALDLAAGRYEANVEIARPIELRLLARDLGALGAILGGKIREITEGNLALEKTRRIEELKRRLVLAVTQPLPLGPGRRARITWRTAPERATIETLQQRHDLLLVAAALIARDGVAPEEMAHRLVPRFPAAAELTLKQEDVDDAD
jgi:methyl-accepting chemotaxis protein